MKTDYNYWIMPTAKTEDDDGRRRNVVFHDMPEGKKKAWLNFKDEQHSVYKIPLGTVEAVNELEERADWDNILVPVVPARYTTYSDNLNLMRKDAQQLEKGWVYVFKDDFLWRELEVTERGHMKDVNLTEYQGEDSRTSTCERDNRVILPYKVNGDVPKIQVCYSQTQWSWARINAMGGMDPKDPRKKDDLQMPTGKQKSKADELRKKRFGDYVDLSVYDVKFNISTGPVGLADDCKSFHARLHHKKVVPILFLHDPLTIAFENASEYLVEFEKLKKTIQKSQQHTHYKSAALAYHALFDPEKTSEPVVTCYGMERGRRDIEYLTDPRDELDEAYIKEILSVDERKKIRKKMRELKRRHVEWLRGNVSVGRTFKPAKSYIQSGEFFIDFNTAIEDYFAKEQEHFVDGFCCFTGVASFLQTDPSIFDQDMDLPNTDSDKPKPEEDEGYLYIAEVINEEHPLYKMLFPKTCDFDPYSEGQKVYKLEDEVNDGSGEFRNASFSELYHTNQEVVFYSQGVRRAFQSGKQVVTDLLSVLNNQWKYAQKNKQKIIEEIMVRISQAANDPDLKGIHLVLEGDDLKGKRIIDGKLRVMTSIKKSETNHLSGSQTTSKKKTIDVYEMLKDGDDQVSYKKIASHFEEDLANFKGYNKVFLESDFENIFVERTSEIEVRARRSYFVIPNTSKIADYFNDPNGPPDDPGTRVTGKLLNAANYGLPPIVVFFEVWNVSQAVEGWKSHRSDTKKTLEIFDALFGLSHSIVEATAIIAGEDAAKRIFGSYLFQNSKMKLFGSTIKRLNLFGAAFAGLTSALALWDVIYYARRQDYGGAFGSFILSTGAGYLAFATLRYSTPLRFFGPLGWVASIVMVLGALAIEFWKDTELETWAKFGPLSKDKTARYTEEYANYDKQEHECALEPGKQAYEALASLLMRPFVKFIRGGDTTYWVDGGISGKYIKGVIATVSLPAFEVGKGNLDLRVTKQHDGLGPDIMTNWSKQKYVRPIKIVQVRDAKTNNIIEAQYHYRPQDAYYAGERSNRFRAKAHITTSDQFRVPAIPPGTPSGDRDESYIVRDNLVDNIWKGTAPGWVYAEPMDT